MLTEYLTLLPDVALILLAAIAAFALPSVYGLVKNQARSAIEQAELRLDALVAETAARLVRFAEQTLAEHDGDHRLRVVLAWMEEAFPDLPLDQLRTYVEAAVYEMNQQKPVQIESAELSVVPGNSDFMVNLTSEVLDEVAKAISEDEL